MRTDPRDACKNEKQALVWAILHDLVAHPLMVLTGYCAWSLRFHNWTSHYAWPRVPIDVRKQGRKTFLSREGHGALSVMPMSGMPAGYFSIKHGTRNRELGLLAKSAEDAAEQADRMFTTLERSAGERE